jgi:hypothetical protein
MSAVSAAGTGFAAGGPWGAVAAAAVSVVGTAASGKAEINQGQAQQAAIDAQKNAFLASEARQRDQWVLGKMLADKDVAIGTQQTGIARAQADVAQGEAEAMRLVHENARAKLTFLQTMFTNAQLYSWMSGLLGDVYRYLLQRAVAVARLAEQQLAFERQAAAIGYIKSDYWAAPGPGAPVSTGGLTGAARLSGDLTRLDQYALDTNQRKLQLTQTFSLSAVNPTGLQYLRQTGILPFTVPLAQWGSPGTYLATIRQVRLSIAALVPPSQNIRGTLTGGWSSSIVVADGADGFRTETLTRVPETVVLTSAANASGVFVVDLNADMLLPFEGCGPDLGFELRLPKAINQFDYRTLADVQLTVDYTAQFSATYLTQVARALPTRTSNTATFSLRDDADAWYDLMSQAQAGPGANRILLARWQVGDGDFPANLIRPIRIEKIGLLVIRNGTTPPAFAVDHLRLNGSPAPPAITAATTVNDIVSTGNGSGSAWAGLIGAIPVGAWELGLTADQATVGALTDGSVQDLVLVLTYGADLPAWPS